MLRGFGFVHRAAAAFRAMRPNPLLRALLLQRSQFDSRRRVVSCFLLPFRECQPGFELDAHESVFARVSQDLFRLRPGQFGPLRTEEDARNGQIKLQADQPILALLRRAPWRLQSPFLRLQACSPPAERGSA